MTGAVQLKQSRALVRIRAAGARSGIPKLRRAAAPGAGVAGTGMTVSTRVGSEGRVRTV